jgi:UDP-N-acetylglucosamine/UDP-N-acetylgalactosamine diphosphorylase
VNERRLIAAWSAAGQEQLFRHWGSRPPEARRRLLDDLQALEPSLVKELAGALGRRRAQAGLPREAGPAGPRIEPLAPIPLAEWRGSREALEAGEQLIASGRTAFLTVAGGQGTRLGWEGPKGCFPVSPLRKASLFQLFAEKILASRRRFASRQLWCIMTSPLNHREIEEFFRAQSFFGLPEREVFFFQQGLLPTLSPEGQLLLAEDGGLAMNPDGHGGILPALRRAGLAGRLREEGVEELFYFQVDNPLVRLPDPEFAGRHHLAGAQMSSKVVPKDYPEERLGVSARIDGRPGVVEYSDLDERRMHARAPSGSLLFAHGSIAIHLLNCAFVARVALPLPRHQARKRVRVLVPEAGGGRVEEREAVKFETFIFDAIPLAANPLFFETSREEEFAPLKNATGVDSIQTCVEGMVRLHSRWLESCGVEVPWEGGKPKHLVEISPLFAADPQALKDRLQPSVNRINEDTLFA